MKAIIARNKAIHTMEIKEPELLPGHVLIRTEYTAVSPGTEMTAVRNSTDIPAPLGYSAVGIIERVSDEVADIRKVGQRVACYGGPYVRHAELLGVPANLTAPVPDHVRSEDAAFAGLGAIAIHALRTADLRFGEIAVIVGLGILGNLTAQIAAAAAYPVIGYDMNAYRASLLGQCGIKHAYAEQQKVEDAIASLSDGFGADSVLLCASGNGEAMFNNAFEWIRDRGKVVVVGDVTTEFSRAKMFKKEAQVLISRAGGPGRYDAGYERENRDYPMGFVRWTEGRNIREYIRLLDEKRINFDSLISGIFNAEDAQKAYDEHMTSASTAMGTLFKFSPK
jgi:threonine dehydrogenase-like Zn-dependent dehydrogenase